MSDDPLEKLRKEQDEPPRDQVRAEIAAMVMPSLEDRMESSGTGDLDMRMQVGEFSHPETGKRMGEVMVGMSGKVWVEFDDGQRVAYTLTELVHTAIDAVSQSEFGPSYDDEEDEE